MNTADMKSLLSSDLPFSSFTKTYTVDYFRIRDDLWAARAQVEDPFYKVIVNFTVSVPDFIIRDSSVRFLIHPYPQCLQIVSRMKGIVGVNLLGPFRDVLRREFLGPKGCETVFNLVSMAGKAMLFAYLYRQEGIGEITLEKYQKFVGKEHGCIVDEPGVPPRKPFYYPPMAQKPDICSRIGETGDPNEPLRTRRFTVEYFELNDDLWRSRSQLVDFEHNIIMVADIAGADLSVQDAGLTFLRQPFKACLRMEERMKKIVGAGLATGFKERVAKDFVGKEGCGNVFNLLNGMHRGFLQFYLMRNTVMERITPDQERLCKEGLKQDCIACNS